MVDFSIIIPCYNSFNLMQKCLESLENQTFKNFEVIIIDDCSIDESLQQLEKYKQKSDLNMTILKNEKNSGPGLSRNIGIKNAKGKFVLFVDSDDFIENNALQIFHDVIEKNNVDCILFDYYFETNLGYVNRHSLLKGKNGIVDKSDAIIYSTGSTCGKVYLLKNILNNNIEFPDLKRCEDLPFTKCAISVSESIYYYNKSFYYYVNNGNSLMHNDKLLSEKYAMEAFEIIYEKLNEKYPKEVEAIFLKQYLYATTSTLVKSGCNKNDFKIHIENAEKRFTNIYKNFMLKDMNQYQKLCIFAIKNKMFLFFKVLLTFRECIRKIGI